MNHAAIVISQRDYSFGQRMNSPAHATAVTPATAATALTITDDDCLLPLFDELERVLRRLQQILQQSPSADSDPLTALSFMSSTLAQVEAAFVIGGADSLAAIAALAGRLVNQCLSERASLPADLCRTLDYTFTRLLKAIVHLRMRDPLSLAALMPSWRALAVRDRTGQATPSAMLSLYADETLLPTVAPPDEAVLRHDPRGEFERAFLRYLRADTPEERLHAGQRITQVMVAMAARSLTSSEKTGWLVLHAAAGLIAAGYIGDSTSSKKLLAAIGRVIRHAGLSEPQALPASLVREALWAIANASEHSSESIAIAQAFGLLAQWPREAAMAEASPEVANEVMGTATDGEMSTVDVLEITAAGELIQSLMASLETPGAAGLPEPVQLTPLIRLFSQSTEWHPITAALSRLQQRLHSNVGGSTQALAFAACLLSLQHALACMSESRGRQREADRIAAVLDEIGEESTAPSGHMLHHMSTSLPNPSMLTALTQALLDCLHNAERQIERLTTELDADTPMERDAAIRLIDQRLSEVHAALCLIEDAPRVACAEQLRDQFRSLVCGSGSQHDALAWDDFAQAFIRLAMGIAAIPRSREADAFSASIDEPRLSTVADQLPDASVVFDPDHGLHRVFLDEAAMRIEQLGHLLQPTSANWSSSMEAAAHAAHALAGCSATVGLSTLRQLALAMEAAFFMLQAGSGPPGAATLSVLDDAVATLTLLLSQLSSGVMTTVRPELLERLLALSLAANDSRHDKSATGDAGEVSVAITQGSDGNEDNRDAADGRRDDIHQNICDRMHADQGDAKQFADPTLPTSSALSISATGLPVNSVSDALQDELRAIFVEEAADLMPQLDQQLRIWKEQPAGGGAPAQMLRILHTLKGSARMAGEIALGDEWHRMEQTVAELAQQSPPDPSAISLLQATLDQWLSPFATVAAAETVMPAAARINGPVSEPDPVAGIASGSPGPALPASARLSSQPAATGSTSAQHRVPMALQLRVRADFLESIANSGAELLVGSARIASELQGQRQSVNDLSDNLGRLRSQLRELEIHAESGIASSATPSASAEFDPLEFDRYTRLHELTRMMNESLADISSLQRTLSLQLENASLVVTAQGRYARVLQSDLRRVRTVPFSSLAGRLQHLLRQVAREQGCDAVLDIDGGHIDIDRGVLDRIAGALEHLVRNAVAHGIEPAVERQALAKPATGKVRMTLSQQGNLLLLQVSDDGRGLDYQRIRQRAIARGLLAAEAEVDKVVLSNLIFEPGFSTASEVTELSGRGIGMDAVRDAVMALGGQLTVDSQPGLGTSFMLSLPLTLATLQIVLVSAGGRDVALPATLVQQMLHLDAPALRQARQAGELAWQGRCMPLYALSRLLNEPPVRTDVATVTATGARGLARRTPVAILRQLDCYLAIELDAVIGHREVVLKNLGPQLAQVPGLAGATVLGDGSITLIINPMPLPEFIAAHAGSREPGGSSASREQQGPRILVVDDSLTVRRASQRLLERHGYRVVLARDGLDALEQLRAQVPAAVLLDIEMPRMDGFELLTALRDDARWRDLPVVMITSRTAERHREHAMKLGASAYLGKPFVEEELLHLLTQWLANTDASHKLDAA